MFHLSIECTSVYTTTATELNLVTVSLCRISIYLRQWNIANQKTYQSRATQPASLGGVLECVQMQELRTNTHVLALWTGTMKPVHACLCVVPLPNHMAYEYLASVALASRPPVPIRR